MNRSTSYCYIFISHSFIHAVSLFNSSLRKALQKQIEVILTFIVKQLKSQPSENRARTRVKSRGTGKRRSV